MPIFIQAESLHARVEFFKEQLPQYKLQVPLSHFLEAKCTLFKLNQLLANTQDESMGLKLTQFLNERWDRVKNTDMQYCHDFNSPANLVSIEIAKVLQTLSNRPYLALLMPTLMQVSAACYISSSYVEHNLDLKTVILNDDNTRLIHVLDVLDFAQDDGILKHNSLFCGKQQNLSLPEEHRLLSRDVSVYQYYQALQDNINFIYNGETAGAYLKRLIRGLRDGGKNVGGTEFNAGLDANVAIVEFNIFLNSLSKNKRNMILNSGKYDRRFLDEDPYWFTIRQSWQRLARGKKTKGVSTSYCVELVAGALEEILEDNPSLFQLISSSETAVTSLLQLNLNIQHSKAAMILALNSSCSYRFYNDEENQLLWMWINKHITKQSCCILEQSDIVEIAQLYANQSKKNKSIAASCKSILLHTGRHLKKAMIQDAVAAMPLNVANQIRAFILPLNQEKRSQVNQYTLYGKNSNKRKLIVNTKNEIDMVSSPR